MKTELDQLQLTLTVNLLRDAIDELAALKRRVSQLEDTIYSMEHDSPSRLDRIRELYE